MLRGCIEAEAQDRSRGFVFPIRGENGAERRKKEKLFGRFWKVI